MIKILSSNWISQQLSGTKVEIARHALYIQGDFCKCTSISSYWPYMPMLVSVYWPPVPCQSSIPYMLP